jgi:hypothetical protein
MLKFGTQTPGFRQAPPRAFFVGPTGASLEWRLHRGADDDDPDAIFENPGPGRFSKFRGYFRPVIRFLSMQPHELVQDELERLIPDHKPFHDQPNIFYP